ncbi:hypothetical protein LCGC14_1176030 [marine sediment metagenome]|uniref:LamG-like jellyroll fold domain-containing protein n=1 Tax=marine sediment metagenome TaxID=412755 RepID=A0A0F9P6I4_9ZZZZ
MVKVTGPMGSHDASGTLRAPPIFSSSLRNRHARIPPAAPPAAAGGSLLFAAGTNNCNAPSINNSNQYPGTIEAWFKPASMNGLLAGTFFGTAIAGASIGIDVSNINAFVAFNNKFYARGQANYLPLATWAHIALTWQINLMQMWINGTLGNQSTGAGFTLTHHSGFHVGGRLRPIDPDLDAHITQVRFSDIRRYTSNFTPATDFTADANTLALYKMLEGTGTTVADDSGNGHTLNFPVSNLPTWSTEIP